MFIMQIIQFELLLKIHIKTWLTKFVRFLNKIHEHYEEGKVDHRKVNCILNKMQSDIILLVQLLLSYIDVRASNSKFFKHE